MKNRKPGPKPPMKTLDNRVPSAATPINVSPNRNLYVVLGVATAVRLVFYASYLNSACNGFLLADHIYYREWALEISAGDWLGAGTFEQGPLYAYLLALGFLLGLPETVVILLQSLTGVAVCLLVYLCGRRLFDERIATAAAIVTALYGPLLYYESELMKSFLSPLFAVLTLYFGLLYAKGRQKRWLCLAGATIGLACLVRESYGLMLLVTACWVAGSFTSPPTSWVTRLGHLVLLAAAFGLVLVPSAVRNYLVAGEAVLVTTGGGEVMYIAHGPEADGYWHFRAVPYAQMNPRQEHRAYRDEAERRVGHKLTSRESSSYWYGEALREIKTHPGRFLLLTARRGFILLNDFEVPDSSDYRTWRSFIPILYPLPTFGWIVGFGLLGLCVCAQDWKRFGLAIGLVAMIVLGVLLTYNFGRFRIGMMPLWILFATAGFFRWVSWCRSNSLRNRVLAVIAGASCLGITVLSFLPPPGADSIYSAGVQEYWQDQVANRLAARKRAAELSRIPEPDARVHAELGHELIAAGRLREGFQHYHLAMDLAQKDARLWVAFSRDLLSVGYESEAIEQVRESIRIDPKFGGAAANNLLVHVMQERPDLLRRFTRELLETGEQACEATQWSNPALLYTLAAVYARTDRLAEAIKTAELGLSLANKPEDERLAASLQALLDSCRKRLDKSKAPDSAQR